MTDHIDGKAVERLVQLINIGGDHCGMGLASEYPPDYEDEFTEGRADNEEYVRASDYDALLSERDALQEQVDDLKSKLDAIHADLDRYILKLGPGAKIAVRDEGYFHMKASGAVAAKNADFTGERSNFQHSLLKDKDWHHG